MDINISKNTFGFAILGTKISAKDWQSTLIEFENALVRNQILLPKENHRIFKTIEFRQNKDGHGQDILLIINDENLIHSNYPFLCKICQSPNRNFENLFDNTPKLAMFWVHDILDYLNR